MGGSMGEEPSCTPPTPPRGFVRWHERRGLLAPGLHSPSRFPSGDEWSAGLEGRLPVTVAGGRRGCSGFRVAPFVFVCTAGLVYRLRHLAAREDRSGWRTSLRQRGRGPVRLPVLRATRGDHPVFPVAQAGASLRT